VVVLVALDLAEPVRKRELGAVAEAPLEMRERVRRVAREHEEVEILHRAPDAEVVLERVAASHEEREPALVQRREHAPVEAARGHRQGPAPGGRATRGRGRRGGHARAPIAGTSAP
jgi:hypothetical protein